MTPARSQEALRTPALRRRCLALRSRHQKRRIRFLRLLIQSPSVNAGRYPSQFFVASSLALPSLGGLRRNGSSGVAMPKHPVWTIAPITAMILSCFRQVRYTAFPTTKIPIVKWHQMERIHRMMWQWEAVSKLEKPQHQTTSRLCLPISCSISIDHPRCTTRIIVDGTFEGWRIPFCPKLPALSL